MKLLREGSSQSDTVSPTSQRASATSGVQENSKCDPEAEVEVEDEQESRSSSGVRSRSTGNSGVIWERKKEKGKIIRGLEDEGEGLGLKRDYK